MSNRHSTKQSWRKHLILIVLLLGFLGRGAHGQASTSQTPITDTSDWAQWKRNCSLTKNFKEKIIGCGSSIFRSRPFHFLAQTIVPGSAVGGGGRYSRDFNEANGSQDQLQLSSVLSIRKFWYAEAKFTTQRNISAEWNKSQQALQFEIYARNRSMPTMPFYGLGPDTQLNNSVQFSQRDTSTGIEITTPFPEVSWLTAGGKVEGLWPSVEGVTSANVISIQQQYTEQTAPGIASQPPFVHEQIFVHPYKRFFKRFALDYTINYNFYQDTDTGHYSFQRFETNIEHRFYPEKKKHGGVIEQNYFLVGWRYSLSYTGNGGAVPFYLQETIGGSDIDNQPTLPAFKDYRFRGPDLTTIRAEYDRKVCDSCSFCKDGLIRTVCSHLGLTIPYDAGEVALRAGDLDFAHFRQSFGGGIAIYLGKDIVFRMAVALGGGEGTHPYFGIANFL